MGRIITLLLAVLGIWVGVEVYNEGIDGAFDGALARFSDGASEVRPTAASAARRAGEAVEAAHAAADERRRELLGR